MSKSKENNWSEMITNFHDTDHLYVLIEEFYNNSIESSSDDKKKKYIRGLYKLEVFRATMQYVEEFAIYFCSYKKDFQDVAQHLVEIQPRDIQIFFEELMGLDKSDRKKIFKNIFYDNLEFTDLKLSEDELKLKIENSVEYIENSINDFADFYKDYMDLYNSIKHGNRVFQVNLDIMNPEFNLEKEDYVLAINKLRGEYTPLTLPLGFLVDQSIIVAKKVRALFKYLHRIIQYKAYNSENIELTFFESSVDENTNKEYIKISSGNQVIIIPKLEELNDYYNAVRTLFSYNFELKGKSLIFHTKFDNKASENYPFLIPMKPAPFEKLTPDPIENFNFKFHIENVNIKQYLELRKIHNALQNDAISNVKIWNDNKNRQLGLASLSHELNFPEIPKMYNDDIIDFLLILERVTKKNIHIPSYLLKTQKKLINENKDKKLLKKDYDVLLNELEELNSKISSIVFTLFIINSNNKISYIKMSDIFFIETKSIMSKIFGEKVFKSNFKPKNPKEKTEITKEVALDFDYYISKYEFFISNFNVNNFPIFVESDNPKFNLKIRSILNENKFWYKKYLVDIIIKPITYAP